MAQLGHKAMQAEQYAAAEALLRHALDVQQQCHGSNHSTTLAIMSSLGQTLAKLHQHQEAELLLRKVNPVRHPSWSNVYIDQGTTSTVAAELEGSLKGYMQRLVHLLPA